MALLKVVIYGYAVELVCGTIPLEAKLKLENYCEANELQLNDACYFREGALAKILENDKIFWRNINNLIHESGLIIDRDCDFDKEGILIEAYRNGETIDFDKSKIQCSFGEPEERLVVSPKQVGVTFGSVEKGGISFECELEEPFDENKLVIYVEDYTKIPLNTSNWE